MTTTKTLILSILLLFIFTRCEEDFQDVPLPPADFPDIVLNLRLPQFDDLELNNGHVVLQNGGLRGIILYRVSETQYNAFEINCSFEPGSASANVRVDNSGFGLVDDSCGSRFSTIDGSPTAGPARSPLRIYTSRLEGDILTITDESANGR